MTFTTNDYPGIKYVNLDPATNIFEEKEYLTRIPKVPLAFSRISTLPSFFKIYQNNCIPQIKYSGENDSGSSSDTHFQGVIRHHNGKDFILSGGDKIDSSSQIFHLSTRSLLGKTSHNTDHLSNYEKGVLNRNPYGVNEVITDHRKKIEDLEDVCTSITKINDYQGNGSGKGFWHGGGMSRLKNIYAVPLESKNDSKIRFFYLQENGSFLHISEAEINDRVGEKAGAVAICRLRNKRYLVAVWQDGDKNGTQNIDFYISKGDSIKTGFVKKSKWFYRECLSTDNIDITYQNIQFLEEKDGQLYLIGMENESTFGPGIKADNIAELLQVDFTIDIHEADENSILTPSIRKLNDKKMPYTKIMHSFDAGSSIYVDKNKEMTLYSCYYYIKEKAFHIAEFPTQLEMNSVKPKSIHFNRIVLYTKPWFGGQIYRIYGDINANIPKVKNLKIDGFKKIKKTFKSIKYQVAPDFEFEIESPSGKVEKLHNDGNVQYLASFEGLAGFEDGIAAMRYL